MPRGWPAGSGTARRSCASAGPRTSAGSRGWTRTSASAGTPAGRRPSSARLTGPTDVYAALLAADVVVPHTDADGLAAGAIALRARGEPASRGRLYGRGENPWRDPPSGIPALLDWGVRAFKGRAVIIDHHAPEADLPDSV